MPTCSSHSRRKFAGTSEWITGLNADLSGPKKAKEKKAPKEKAPKKTQKAE